MSSLSQTLQKRPARVLSLDSPLAGLVIPVVLVIFWQVTASLGLLPRYLVAPGIIAVTWWDSAISGELLTNIASSLFRQSLGFLIGASLGVLIGLLAGVFRPVERFYEPLISLIYPVPKVAVLPLIFAWFGLGSLSKIVVMIASIFFPTYIAAYNGTRNTSRYHVWAAQNTGASRSRIFFRIVLPSAMPDIFSGLRIGLALSFVLMVTTELVVSTSGLGYMIGQASDTLRFDRMYAAIFTIGVIGVCTDRILHAVRRHLLRGYLVGKE